MQLPKELMAQYDAPESNLIVKFSVRLDPEDNIRLIHWASQFGCGEEKKRAPAARRAIREYLDSLGVPPAEEILERVMRREPLRDAS